MSKGTQTIYVSGEAKWSRVYAHQMDKEYNADGVFHLSLAPDEASKIVLKQSGSRIEGKPDEDGKLWYKFRRANKVEFKPGEVEVLGPPEVLTMEDGNPVPFSKNIGNGSKVTLRLEVYPSRKGVGTRLVKVCVDEHVPYETEEPTLGGYAF